MKIVVLVKTETGAAVDRDDAFQRSGRVTPGVLAPFDRNSVEEAIRIADANGGAEVVIAAVAGPETLGAVREALAFGADRAVILHDRALEGSDLMAVSRAVAALLRRETADLYLTCSWTGDIDGSMLWVAAADRLNLPVLTQARRLSVAGGKSVAERQVEGGDVTVEAPLPCMVEVTETINVPRYPTIKHKAAARSKPVEMLQLADVGLASTAVGAAGSATRVTGLRKPEPRGVPIVVDDANAAPARIVAFLEERHLLP